MIVYHSDKIGFLRDLDSNEIEKTIHKLVIKNLHKRVSESEINSWRNSMNYVGRIVSDSEIPDDSGIAIEYQLPQASKRIDFIITGQDETGIDSAIVLELKQWQKAELTNKDALVKTHFQGRKVETTHPSYQVWSYVNYLKNFNEAIYSGNINLKPCAYLHNYSRDGIMDNEFYKDYTDQAPLFFKSDAEALRTFIKKYVKHGDKSNLIYQIDSGKIKPSKNLADNIASMLKGNQEFIMLDDQKVVFENALQLVKDSKNGEKKVLIVHGGPGTGKSVVAVNLLAHLTSKRELVHYVSKNAAPRNVYESKLTGSMKASHIRNIFKGSGSYIDSEMNCFDALIVDESHRLNEKSGLYSNQGFNQINEIIYSSKCSVFFLDEDQRVTLKDIGSKEEIYKHSKENFAEVHELELKSQFRCNGSDGYISWLNNILQIRETADINLSETDFEFKVLKSPKELQELIIEKNKINNKARTVAGYCWKWISKKDKSLWDIEFEDFDFKAKWNLASDGNLWILKPDSVSEIGCIHTCQGLELDYIGVIIGEDLIVRNAKVITQPEKRASSDNSIRGYKKLLTIDPENTYKKLDQIIKNTYKTLLTRGMKAAYIYCVDKETEEYFSQNIKSL